MAQSTKAIARLLSKEEHDLVASASAEAMKGADDAALRDLAAKLRERRDRARDIGRQQRREMRGKAAPRGAEAAQGNAGTKAKADALTSALKRVGAERTRRTEKAKQPSQRSIARKALALKQRQRALARPSTRTAGEGMQPVPNKKAAKSGALNDAGARPALMRSKIARQ
jgi:hypothetical protein